MHPLLQAREGHDFLEIGGCSEPFTLLEAPGFQGPIINGEFRADIVPWPGRSRSSQTHCVCTVFVLVLGLRAL